MLRIILFTSIKENFGIRASWTGTNADDFQMSREGVAVCNVSLLLRYMHTPLEVVNLDDIENCAKLIAAYILSLKEGN